MRKKNKFQWFTNEIHDNPFSSPRDGISEPYLLKITIPDSQPTSMIPRSFWIWIIVSFSSSSFPTENHHMLVWYALSKRYGSGTWRRTSHKEMHPFRGFWDDPEKTIKKAFKIFIYRETMWMNISWRAFRTSVFDFDRMDSGLVTPHIRFAREFLVTELKL